MKMEVRISREAYCPRCNFGKWLETNEEPPESCPACGDGQAKSWGFTRGEDND